MKIRNFGLNKKAQEIGYGNLYDFFDKNSLLSFYEMAEILKVAYQSVSRAYSEYVIYNEQKISDGQSLITDKNHK